jgi:hypothetical protein
VKKSRPQGLSVSSDLRPSEEIVSYQQDEEACQQDSRGVHCMKFDEEEG